MNSLNRKLLILFLLGSLNSITYSQKKEIVKSSIRLFVTGMAHDFEDSSWLYLEKVQKKGKESILVVDSALVIDGKFSFYEDLPSTEFPREIFIRTKDWSDYKNVWIEDKPIVISGIKGGFKNAIIYGSATQTSMEKYEKLVNPLVTTIDSLRRNFGNTDTLIYQSILELDNSLIEKTSKFIVDHPDSYASVILLNRHCMEWGKSLSQKLYNSLSSKNKRTVFARFVEKYFRLNQQIEIGSKYVDIKQPTPEGKIIQLSKYEGKYILLEFWASWCGPCRKENPNLVSTYNEFKANGFEIFSVSLDREKLAWTNAINRDGLIWPQVSELNGNENTAVHIYGVHGIPANYLINKEGKIIAKNLRGVELRNKLKELFK